MHNLPYVEMALMNSVKTQDDLAAIIDSGAIFGEYAEAFTTLQEYMVKYGSAPDISVFKARFAVWEATEEPFEFWFAEWLRVRKAFATQKALSEALTDVGKDPDNPEVAVSALLDKLGIITTFGGVEAFLTDGSITDRLAHYHERGKHFNNSSFKLWGIPTGISAIDASREGWMPGELIGFYARPTVGKTWMLLREGVIAWMAGNRVLMISPEIPANQAAFRIDALIAGQQQLPFSHSKARTGDPSISAQYEALAATINGHDRWHTVSDIAGREVKISDIAALTARYKPDLILVDGVSLLGDDRNGKQEWERMKNVCYDLKRFATSAEVAVICSHQATNTRRGSRSDRDAAQGRGDDWVLPTLNDAAFGDAFVQAMSTVFTMAPDRELEYIRWYSIRKTRERNIELRPRCALAWDVDRGVIVDLGKYGDDINAIQQQLNALGIKPRLPTAGA